MTKKQPQQNELWIDLDKYKTIKEKMELLEGIMDLLDMDYGIDDHTEDKGYPYYFIQIEEEDEKINTNNEYPFKNLLNDCIERYNRNNKTI